MYTVFPQIVSEETIIFWKCKMWKFSYNFCIMAMLHKLNSCEDIRLLNILAVCYVHCATQWNPSSVESYRVHQICFFALWYLVNSFSFSLPRTTDAWWPKFSTTQNLIPNPSRKSCKMYENLSCLQKKWLSNAKSLTRIQWPKIPQTPIFLFGQNIWDQLFGIFKKKTIIGCPCSLPLLAAWKSTKLVL